MALKKQVKIIEKMINIVIIFLLGVAILNIFFFKDNLMNSYNYKFIMAFSIIYGGIFLATMYFFKRNNRKNISSKSSKNSIKNLIMYIFLILSSHYVP